MNILIISDNFTMGGLETHISTYWNELKDKHTCWFCFSNYRKSELIDDDHVYTGFHFTYDETLSQLQEDVNRLVEIINEKKIDAIHVHPWFGLYAACFASAITNVKVVYTYHGTGSINYNGNINDSLFMQEVIASSIAHVYCVSRLGQEAFESIGFNRTSLLRNPINSDDYKALDITGSKKWALVSRLDADKIGAIQKLLGYLPALDIDKLDIYGDGTCTKIILEQAEKINKEISYNGHVDELQEAIIDGGYDGVIGLGRCAIEGLAFGLPVLLVGYDRVVGLIGLDEYEIAKDTNFLPDGLKERTVEEINEQIADLYADPSSYTHRERVFRDFDINNISKMYIRTLAEIAPRTPQYVKQLYEKLVESLAGEDPIFHSEKCYNIFKDQIRNNTRNIYVKDIIMLEERIKTLEEKICKLTENQNKLTENQNKLTENQNKLTENQQEYYNLLKEQIDSMGIKYFLRQSIEWRKNQINNRLDQSEKKKK